MLRLAFITLALLSLQACVTPIPLSEQSPNLDFSKDGKLLVSVIDQRERVNKGKKDTFVGVAHGSFGIPVDWHVKNVLATEKLDMNRNLSQFLEHRITTGLNQRGWNAEAVDFSQVPSNEAAIEKMTDAEATSLLVLNLNEWYFSINLNWVTAFNFDTNSDVVVYHLQDGNVLNKNFTGRDVIEETASESPQNNVLRAYRDQLLEMFNDPDVRAALLATTPAMAETEASDYDSPNVDTEAAADTSNTDAPLPISSETKAEPLASN